MLSNKTTLQDMERIREAALDFVSAPTKLPVTFTYGGKEYTGIPASYNPTASRKIIDSKITEITFEGTDPNTGLNIKIECIEYKDFPVYEWTAYFKNTGSANTPIIENLYAINAHFPGKDAYLHANNGDPGHDDGFKTEIHELGEGSNYSFAPVGGRGNDGASPFYKLTCENFGYIFSIGWPAQWQSFFTGGKEGFSFAAKQQHTRFYLMPNETFRTPRMTLMAFEGDGTRGTNIWRRWYMAHVLPCTRGDKLEPKLIAHVTGGGEEFTLADENNQIEGINEYIRRGLKFDIWWIDAGWYPCKDENGVKSWPRTGTWIPDPEKFPNGLTPVGKCCDENDVQLLVWFEPERVILDYWPKDMGQHYLLKRRYKDAEGNEQTDATALLDMANPEVADWITKKVGKLISDSHIKVYRQDFNMAPLEWWLQNESEDRRGTKENFHTQAYLKYWDDLLAKNPDLWIDSCASGGRRNDLETLRRAVPLQYTDCAIPDPVIKTSFNYTMFQWVPYFRNHTSSAYDENGELTGGIWKVGHYAYQAAMCPSLTCMVSPYDQSPDFGYAKKMNEIWRKAAEFMLDGDYYPLLPCSKSKEGWYAVQFHREESGSGIIQGIRHIKSIEESVAIMPQCFDDDKSYIFTSPEFGKELTISGREINQKGFTFNLNKASGELWLYRAIDCF
jgi:alpha-galactosidase